MPSQPEVAEAIRAAFDRAGDPDLSDSQAVSFVVWSKRFLVETMTLTSWEIRPGAKRLRSADALQVERLVKLRILAAQKRKRFTADELAAELKALGLSHSAFAQIVQGDSRLVRRWLKEQRDIPPFITPVMTLLRELHTAATEKRPPVLWWAIHEEVE